MAAAALAYLDPGEFGGALQATSNGFQWAFVVAYRDTGTNAKAVVSGVHALTLDGDTLVQMRDKINAAVKADGAARGFAVTSVMLPSFQVTAV